MSIMKQKMLYAIIVIVIIAVVLAGWYYFSAQGAYLTNWKCIDTQTYTCFNGTTNYTCSNGVLNCQICTTNYTIKDYNVTLIAIGNQTIGNSTVLAGVFTINSESAMLSAGQTKMLLDQTIFGVTTLYLNYSAFYLQAAEKKSSSLTAPFPKSTTITLIVSIGGGCGGASYSCPAGYTPSCSGSTLTCTKTWYQCNSYNPGNCTAVGVCGGGGGGGRNLLT